MRNTAESSSNESPSDTGSTDEEDTPLPPKTDVAVKTAQVAAGTTNKFGRGAILSNNTNRHWNTHGSVV